MPERYRRIIVNGQRVSEHRHVMQQHLGYELPKHLHVHHKNGNRYDNRLENLEVIDGREHAMLHAPQRYPLTKQCAVCGNTFTPHPTKRLRAMTCGGACGRMLAAQSRRKLSQDEQTEARVLYMVGMTQTAIAERFNVTQATVWEVLRRAPSVECIATRLAEAIHAA